MKLYLLGLLTGVAIGAFLTSAVYAVLILAGRLGACRRPHQD